MAKETDRREAGGRPRRWIHSLRVQVGSMVLLSYLIPVALLGIFTGRILLNRL